MGKPRAAQNPAPPKSLRRPPPETRPASPEHPKPPRATTARQGGRLPPKRPPARPPRGGPGPGPQETLEGWNAVLEGLRAGRSMNKLLLAEDVGRHSGIAEVLGLAKEQGVVVERVDRRALDRIGVTRVHQGVIAMVAAKDYADLDDLLAAAREKAEPPLLVALDGIVDPQNLGAVIRTADGAGAHGVIIPERRAAGLTAAVARASAGALEYVPVARVGNLGRTLTSLAREQLWTIGVDPGAEQDYTKADYRRPAAIVIGAEGKGLSNVVREGCDTLVSIPMRGRVASLNAAVAAALVLYEAVRQRRASPGA